MKITRDTYVDGGTTKWKCSCGQVHPLTAYVHAHWSDELIHDCEKCGAKHSILRGVVRFVKKGKEAKK